MKSHRDTAAALKQVAMQGHGEREIVDWETESCEFEVISGLMNDVAAYSGRWPIWVSKSVRCCHGV